MYISETVDVRNADGYRGSLELWVSEGESDPEETVMELFLPGDYTLVRLDLDSACHLRSVLDNMIKHHESLVSAG